MVYSDYGNPGTKIETPKVLKRLDVETVEKNAMTLIKEMNCSHGSLNLIFQLQLRPKKPAKNPVRHSEHWQRKCKKLNRKVHRTLLKCRRYENESCKLKVKKGWNIGCS
jgi:hypothetical protein